MFGSGVAGDMFEVDEVSTGGIGSFIDCFGSQRTMSCETDIRGLVFSMAVLSGETFNFMCVDLTRAPDELLVLGPPFCCGENITDVCGKVDVTMVAVDSTVDAVVICSVMWT